MLNEQHATTFAVDIFGSVHVSSLVPDSKFRQKIATPEAMSGIILPTTKRQMLGSRSETMWQNTERKVCY